MNRRADTQNLADLSDVELVARYQEGCEAALQLIITRYRRFARAKARNYFLVGADHDDVEQEALIGLYKAARDFRPEHLSSFQAFAELCITRQIITAIKTATRQKHQALNQYVSFSSTRSGDDDERSVEELIQVHRHDADPADRVIAGERFNQTRERLGEVLSPLEVDVLHLYVEGRSYQEIGEMLDRHVKSIDNALQRIKRKLGMHLAEREASDRADELALTA